MTSFVIVRGDPMYLFIADEESHFIPTDWGRQIMQKASVTG